MTRRGAMTAGGWFAIEALRGEEVESRHRIHAVVVDRHGAVQAWGDRSRPTIPRSAIKAIQALPIITTGAGEAFGVSPEELALACASHSAEPEHVTAVLGWLDRLGLDEEALECGPDRPMGAVPRKEFYATRSEPRPVFNCCSGKHAGFLTVTRHLDQPTAGYVERDSPAQRLVASAIGSLTGLELAEAPSGIDGCGIPVFALPLERLGFAMARLVDPVDLDDEVALAAGIVVEAAQLGFWVSGSARTEVKVAEAATEPVVIKTGAEGVFMVGLPARGVGIALKAADGTPRAARAAVWAILQELGVVPAADAVIPAPIPNKAGTIVGQLRAVISPPGVASLSC